MSAPADPRPRGRYAVWLAALALTVGACGPGQAGKGGTATVTTRPGDESVSVVIGAHDVYFDPEVVTAPAGTVDFTLNEEGSQTHTLLIEDIEDFKLAVSPSGKDDSGSIVLEAGEYVYYCDIPGHRAQGMEGRLTLG